jgi:hypothetical protein
VLRGDRVVSYDRITLAMGVDTGCQTFCHRSHLHPDTVKQLASLITHGYRVDWILNGLPGALALESAPESPDPLAPNAPPSPSQAEGRKKYEYGFPLGYVHEGQVYVHNHLHLNLLFETLPTSVRVAQSANKTRRLVGFEVLPIRYAPPPSSSVEGLRASLGIHLTLRLSLALHTPPASTTRVTNA